MTPFDAVFDLTVQMQVEGLERVGRASNYRRYGWSRFNGRCQAGNLLMRPSTTLPEGLPDS